MIKYFCDKCDSEINAALLFDSIDVEFKHTSNTHFRGLARIFVEFPSSQTTRLCNVCIRDILLEAGNREP